MLERLLALGKQAVNEHLICLNELKYFLRGFFCEQCIQNNLCFGVVVERLYALPILGGVGRHERVELNVKLLLNFLLETESAQLREYPF